MNLFLNFVSYPTSAEQLNNKIEYDHMTDMQLLDDGGFVNWTISPKAKDGDLILFYHTDSALTRIKKVEADAKKAKILYDKLKPHIDLSYGYFKKFGASIFAIGIVYGNPEVDKEAFGFETHFKERCFANISDINMLNFPIKKENIEMYLDLKKHISKKPIDKSVAKNLLLLIADKNDLSFKLNNQIDLFIKK